MSDDESITKAELLTTMRERRAEFDTAVAQIPHNEMTQPGAAGHWSVKDIIAHVTYYERWMADRMHEQLRGEQYTPNELDRMHFEPRNALIYEKVKDLPLDQVLGDSRSVFERLMAVVEAHSEEFLTMPQRFNEWPEPITVWKMLRSEVYQHYGEHVPSLLDWARRKHIGS
jgi:hypothetical protein